MLNGYHKMLNRTRSKAKLNKRTTNQHNTQESHNAVQKMMKSCMHKFEKGIYKQQTSTDIFFGWRPLGEMLNGYDKMQNAKQDSFED